MAYNEVILYARFSDPTSQRDSVSIKRQTELGSEWCERKGLIPTATITDEGFSGYHGRHRSAGSLGVFEAEAVAGLHHNALLIVERIDRLSREGHRETNDLINRLSQAGVSIATVKPDRIFEAGVEMSLTDAITLLVEADLARKESVRKAELTAFNWTKRKEVAARTGRALSATVCPPWLTVVDGSYRPPTGFWDAVTLESQGRDHFLKPPVYYSSLAVFALIALFGFVALIRPKARDDDY